MQLINDPPSKGDLWSQEWCSERNLSRSSAPSCSAATQKQISKLHVPVLGVGNALINSWRFICNGTESSLTPGQPRFEITGQENFKSISKKKYEGFHWGFFDTAGGCYWMWFVFWSAITVEQPLLSRQSQWPYWDFLMALWLILPWSSTHQMWGACLSLCFFRILREMWFFPCIFTLVFLLLFFEIYILKEKSHLRKHQLCVSRSPGLCSCLHLPGCETSDKWLTFCSGFPQGREILEQGAWELQRPLIAPPPSGAKWSLDQCPQCGLWGGGEHKGITAWWVSAARSDSAVRGRAQKPRLEQKKCTKHLCLQKLV